MNKKLILTTLVAFFAASLFAQDPVHFSYELKKISEKNYELHITANVDDGWHIYSQTQPKEAVAEPTKIVFKKNPLVQLTGQPKEVGNKERYEEKTVGIIQYQYGHQVDFVQSMTLKSKAKMTLSGSITYQVCTDEMCLPAKTVPFSIPTN